jgi:prolyl-tRNA editing enzyme YbaK/EbsC (Cys-tRNA(Pro) deacylase)
MYTPADLAAFIRAHGIAAELITDIGPTPTVPAAAAALGVSTERILKTLVFYVRSEPYTVIAHGTAPVREGLLAKHFGVGKRQVRLARPDEVLAVTGYPAGGVPPFGHRQPTPVLVLSSLLAWDVVYGGGGDDRTMLQLTTAELLRVTRPTILTVDPTG